MDQHSTLKRHSKKIIFVLLLMILYITVYAFVNSNSKGNDYLTQPWEISHNGDTTYTVHQLKDANFRIKPGDKLTLHTKLPDYNYQHPMLKLWFYHCEFKVRVNEELIYESGYKEYDKGFMVPNGAFLIALPSNAMGASLEIELRPHTRNPFSSLPNPAIQEESVMIRNYLMSNSVQILIGGFLMIIGVFLLLLKFFYARRSFFTVRTVFIGVLSIISAAWLFISSGLLRNLVGYFPYMTELEYLLLYAAPIPIVAYIMDHQTDTKLKKICKVILRIFSVFTIATVLLHTASMIYYSTVLPVFHLLAFLALGLLLWITLRNYRLNKDYSERIFLFGMFTILALLLADIVKFNVTKYITLAATTDTVDIIVPISILILVFSMITSGLESLLQTYQDNIESRAKDKYSHLDGLTGLANRMKCTEYLDSTIDTAIVVTFDIEHLNEVNEIYGHSHGDIYLKAFADCLKNVFPKAEFIGRIGDDEFVVVEKGLDKEQIEKEIAYLDDLAKVAVTDSTCPLNFKHSFTMTTGQVLWKAYERNLAQLKE